MKKGNGFTLVEIMITVSIIGLLGGLAGYAILRTHRKALCKQAESELNFLSTSILNLAWDSGKWPNKALRTESGSIEVWNLNTASTGLLSTDGTYGDWKGPYYEGAVLDPWGNPYFFDPDYTVKGVQRVVVGSFGPNGVGQNKYDSDDIIVLLDD